MTSGHVLRLVPHQVKDRTGHLLLKGPSSPTDTQPADSRGRFNRARCSLCTSHWATSSYSPPLTVKILGPVGDIKLLVSLTSLLPPPLGSLVGSWLWPLLAHNFCEDILADRSPVSSLWPQGTPLEPGTRKTLLADPMSSSAHIRARFGEQCRQEGQNRAGNGTVLQYSALAASVQEDAHRGLWLSVRQQR